MSSSSFIWNGVVVPFCAGETIASALEAAGVLRLGRSAPSGENRYFCGIGACQCCLVRIGGKVVEACLTPATEGLVVEQIGGGDDHVA